MQPEGFALGVRGGALTVVTPITAAPMRPAFFSATEVSTATRPRDIPDLYLAPAALAADARIEELGPRDY